MTRNRKYFVIWDEAYDEYDLIWTDSDDAEREAIENGYERITRQEAIRLCRKERERRKMKGHSLKCSSTYIEQFFPEEITNALWFGNMKQVVKDSYIIEYEA